MASAMDRRAPLPLPLLLLLLLLLLFLAAASPSPSHSLSLSLDPASFHPHSASSSPDAAAEAAASSSSSSSSCDASSSSGGRCNDLGSELRLDSEANRRILAGTSAYISYNALTADRVPCSSAGRSYYNCRGSGPVNPYTRGCSRITGCARDTS